MTIPHLTKSYLNIFKKDPSRKQSNSSLMPKHWQKSFIDIDGSFVKNKSTTQENIIIDQVIRNLPSDNDR